MANLRQTLYAWRDAEAAKKGIELFRVLPNTAIDEIVKTMPTTKESLTAIKGIKDAKFAQYGAAIIAMVKEHSGNTHEKKTDPDAPTELSHFKNMLAAADPDPAYSVSTYLDIINRELGRLRARVRGEVTSFKFQGSAVYFAIADEKDGSTLSVFMWQNDLTLSGVELSEGLVVTIEGRSEIYKPSGRFNFRADTIELVGEGALKKAYDDLKKKLTDEGLFDPRKKKTLQPYPVRIGLITSRTGAVIHDFLNNLGRYGYKITFVDSRVEGAMAVKEILAAIKVLQAQSLDVLVLVRGGGSLESLQAFNNEAVVRALAEFPAVTIAAIGHDKDVPLVQLAADYAPSTPTATTVILNESWEALAYEVRDLEQRLIAKYDLALWQKKDELRSVAHTVENGLKDIIHDAKNILASFEKLPNLLMQRFEIFHERLNNDSQRLQEYGENMIKEARNTVSSAAEVLRLNDPERILRLGYSILRQHNTILRSVSQVSVGERFEARLSDGTLVAEITEKRN